MTEPKIEASWVAGLSEDGLRFVLPEYRYLVHRFPQWIALTVGRCDIERVRQLLLPNLLDETGTIDGAPSHLSLLDRLIRSCGLGDPGSHLPTQATQDTEDWFFSAFSERGTYECLCVLGPATESISDQFLNPLERAIRRVFTDRELDLTYFDEHRPEVEAEHAEQLNEAIRYYENQADDAECLGARQDEWVSAGVSAHSRFWDSLRAELQQRAVA